MVTVHSNAIVIGGHLIRGGIMFQHDSCLAGKGEGREVGG